MITPTQDTHTPHKAPLRYVPNLAWTQAAALTRNPKTGVHRRALAVVTYLFFLVQAVAAWTGGRLFHRDRMVVAIAHPYRSKFHLVGVGAIVALALVVVFGVLGLIEEFPVPVVVLLVSGWMTFVALILMDRRAGAVRAQKVLDEYQKATRAPALVSIAKTRSAPAGIGAAFTRALSEQVSAEGPAPALIALTDRHVGIYEQAGYVPLEGTRAMVYRPGLASTRSQEHRAGGASRYQEQ